MSSLKPKPNDWPRPVVSDDYVPPNVQIPENPVILVGAKAFPGQNIGPGDFPAEGGRAALKQEESGAMSNVLGRVQVKLEEPDFYDDLYSRNQVI